MEGGVGGWEMWLEGWGRVGDVLRGVAGADGRCRLDWRGGGKGSLRCKGCGLVRAVEITYMHAREFRVWVVRDLYSGCMCNIAGLPSLRRIRIPGRKVIWYCRSSLPHNR